MRCAWARDLAVGFHRCRRRLGGNQARAVVVASVTPPGLIAVVRGRPTGVSSAVISDRGGASDARSMRRRRASAVTLLRSALSPSVTEMQGGRLSGSAAGSRSREVCHAADDSPNPLTLSVPRASCEAHHIKLFYLEP